jgi:hypothetical protein
MHMRGSATRLALSALAVGASMLGGAVGTASAASCTETGFVKDGIDLTAAMINPSGTVTGR